MCGSQDRWIRSTSKVGRVLNDRISRNPPINLSKRVDLITRFTMTLHIDRTTQPRLEMIAHVHDDPGVCQAYCGVHDHDAQALAHATKDESCESALWSSNATTKSCIRILVFSYFTTLNSAQHLRLSNPVPQLSPLLRDSKIDICLTRLCECL